MKRYTDAQVMKAIQQSWLDSGVNHALDHYVGDRYKIHSQDRHDKSGYVRALVQYIKDVPAHVLRGRLKKLADSGLLIIYQYRKGGVISINPPLGEAQRLIELGRSWWVHLGYNETELLPAVNGHRLPDSEQEIHDAIAMSTAT
ncbi:hypothetical protein D3C84_816990 [compost metagenome]